MNTFFARWIAVLSLNAFGALVILWSDLPAAELLHEVAKIAPDDLPAERSFGRSTIDGDTMVVVGANAAYVFQRSGAMQSDWSLVRRIPDSESEPQIPYFAAVSLSGDTLAIGSGGYIHPTLGVATGAVLIYRRDRGGGDQWGHVETLFSSDIAAGDLFGSRLQLDGDTLVVSATKKDEFRGAVYVFERTPGTTGGWTQSARLEGVDNGPDSMFGFSLSLDGLHLVVGQNPRHPITRPVNDEIETTYLFQRPSSHSGEWQQVGSFDIAKAGADLEMGRSVSIRGDVLVTASEHAVYIFHRDYRGISNWGHVRTIHRFGSSSVPLANGTALGSTVPSVAVDEENLVVGWATTAWVYTRNTEDSDLWQRSH